MHCCDMLMNSQSVWCLKSHILTPKWFSSLISHSDQINPIHFLAVKHSIVLCKIHAAHLRLSPSLELASPSLHISPHTGSALSSTGWPFQPCLCPRWILSPPLVPQKLDCYIFFFFTLSLSVPFLLSAEKGNGQDVKLVLICCSREWPQYETHYIKKHFELMNEIGQFTDSFASRS